MSRYVDFEYYDFGYADDAAGVRGDIQRLEPGDLVELFHLDMTGIGGDHVRFHAGTNSQRANVVWQGQTYTAFPVKASGFELTGSGQIPRPKLQVSNVLGTITAFVLDFEDMLGAKITRKRTFAKYLDAVNFSGGVNPTADPSAEFPDEVYFVERKSIENKIFVEFELSAAFDVHGVMLPRRQIISNHCVWAYKGAECGYVPGDMFDALDNPVTLSALDVCGKRLSSCKKRFGGTSQLAFGGFPASGLIR